MSRINLNFLEWSIETFLRYSLILAASAQAVATSENTEDYDAGQDHARLLTAVSGFPKTKGSYNIDHILKV